MKICALTLFACSCVMPPVYAGSITIGSLQGQDGWSGGSAGVISPYVDQEVTNAAANQGTQSLRVSNKDFNGNFSQWIFGPGLFPPAGQPSSGAAADRLALTLFFRSVSSVADGSNLEIELGNSTGTDRTTFTAITDYADDGRGLTLRAAETNSAGSFYAVSLLRNNLSRTDWHRLDIVASYLDGAANDYFQLFLDDPALANPISSPNTSQDHWGTFEPYNAAAGGPYNLVNRLYLRSGAAPSAYGPFVNSAVTGFYFDDVSYRTWNSANPDVMLASYSTSFEDTSGTPEPGSLWLLAGGGLLLLRKRG